MNKRFNKFTKTLKNFSDHPMFSKLRKLYIEDDVKQLRTAENWLMKMSITKKGDITKKALGLVNKINEMYEKYVVKVEATLTYTYKKLSKPLKLYQGKPIFFTEFKIWIRKQMKKWQSKYNTTKFIVDIKFYNDSDQGVKLINDVYYLDFPSPNPQKVFYDYMETHYWDFMLGSGRFKVQQRDDNKIDTITFQPINQLNAIKTKQSFLDSVNSHCFLDPISNWANDCLENSKSVSAQKKYKAIINKIDKKWRPEFINGFDEDKIDDLCKDINVNIKVDLPFKNSSCKMIESIGNKQPLKVFKFINTRINHVNEIVSDISKLLKSNEITSVDDMETIYNDYIKSGEYIICNKNSTGDIIKINTLENVYTYTDDYVKSVMEFEKNNNLNMYKLDYVSDNKVCEFIDSSIHFNTVCQFSNKRNLDLEHIDQKQAYTQFKKCSVYQGFLGKITDFRRCTKEFSLNNIGIYQISHIEFYDDKMKQLNDKMKIYNNKCVYPSSDLLFLNKYANFEVIGGCYGIKCDIEFDKKMIETKINDVPYYAKYTGSISKVNEYKNFYMNGTKEFFENMLCNTDDTKINYDEKTSQAQIQYKKDYIPYKCHIASFILSYQRIHMLNQLMQMDVNKIVRIVTDGIYYDDHVFEICDTFREKKVDDIEKLAYYNDASNYLTNINKYDGVFNKIKEHHKINYYKGAGGTGKTYSILTDNGYIKPLYIAPSWKLARRMRKDFKCDVSVLARVIQNTEEMYFFKSNFNVIIFDEVSQYTKNDRDAILKNFDKHKIYFIGDIGYQLPPATDPVMTIHSKWHTKEFNKVYRFQCDKLTSLCEKLREFISIGKSKEFISDYVLNTYTDRCFKDINNYCHTTDYILCSKNKCNVHHKIECDCDGKNYALQWTNKFKHLEKYLVKSNSLNYCNGDITFEKVPNSILTHAFSISSIQGETIEGNIYIDMRNMFNPQMLYTAISRARKLEQLHFIMA